MMLGRCGSNELQDAPEFTGELWSQNVMGLLGGSLLATEGDGKIARREPSPGYFETLDRWLNPIASAHAAIGACPTVSRCLGEIYETELLDCTESTMQVAGVWRAIHRITLPDAATCQNVLTSGFSPAIHAALVGKTVARTYGQTQAGNQTDVWRLGANDEAVLVYTDFPSGIADEEIGAIVKGGVQVAFDSSDVRRVTILGAHVLGWKDRGKRPMIVDDMVPWSDIGYSNPKYQIQWDTTVHTPEAIEVTGYGVGKKVTKLKAHTQHNIVQALGVTELKKDEPLVYGLANCCWPTSGAIVTNFKRIKKSRGPKWGSEEIVFKETCGTVDYITYRSTNLGGSPRKRTAQLNHCY